MLGIRLKSGLLSWSYNIDLVSMWSGAEWGCTRYVCSPETATKTASFRVNCSVPWWCNSHASQDDMFNSRRAIRFKNDSVVSSVHTISLCKRALQWQFFDSLKASLQNFSKYFSLKHFKGNKSMTIWEI